MNMDVDVITYNNMLRFIGNMLDTGRITSNMRDLIADAIRQTYGFGQEDRDTTMNAVDVQKVIFNPPATIVFWGDGTKTVVKTMSGESFDMYHGFTAALAKKIYGNSTRVRKIVHNFKANYYKNREKKTKQPSGVGFPFQPSCRCEIKDSNDDAH